MAAAVGNAAVGATDSASDKVMGADDDDRLPSARGPLPQPCPTMFPPPRARKMTRMSRYRLQRLATPPSASRTRRPQGQMGASGFEQTATSTPRHTRMSGTLVPDSTRPPSRPGRPDSAPPASLAPVSLALDLGACK